MNNYHIKSVYILSILSIILGACSGKEDVPEAVQLAFANRFPDAADIKWEMENPKEWEAEFELNEIEYSANFSLSGEWLETEHEMPVAQIPKEVISLVDSKYRDVQFGNAEVIDSPMGQGYELELKSGKEELMIEIDPDGIIRQVHEENDKED